MSDVVIVGAGPAGMECAFWLAIAGVPCTLLDDNPEAGGQIFRTGPGAKRLPDLPGKDARGETMRASIATRAGLITFRPQTQVVGLHAGPVVWAVGPDDEATVYTPRALVLATGAVEISVPVPGWTLPGVYSLGGLQTLLKSSALVPQGPVVLGGAGPLLYLLAAQLVALGVKLAAVVDAADYPTLQQAAVMACAPMLFARGIGFMLALRRHNVPVFRRHAIIEVVGEDTAREVVIAPVDAEWRTDRTAPSRRIPAQVVGMGFGIRPNIELSLLAGCEHDFDPRRGGWHVRREDGPFASMERRLMTTIDGIYAIGDGATIGGVEHALCEGWNVAVSVRRRLGVVSALGGALTLRPPGVPDPTFLKAMADWSAVRPGIFEAATPDTVICRCEDVTRADLERNLAHGIDLPRGLKMATRMGMGLCQGRTCAPALQHLTARATGRPVAEIALPSVRTPVRPVSMAALAQLPIDASERTS